MLRDDSSGFTMMPDRHAGFGKALLNPDLDIPDGITDFQGVSAPKRFAVYRNNVVVSLIEAMQAAYPSVCAILGEENFTKVARFYIRAHPPRSPLMSDFGSEFAAFLSDFKPLAGSAFLIDVALLERAWLEAWHAVDHTALEPATLGSIPPEQLSELVFEIHPAAKLVVSPFPLADLFAYRTEIPGNGVDLSASQPVLITRPAFEVELRVLDSAASSFIDALMTGRSLGEALTAALEEDADADPSSLIGLMLESGAFFLPATPS